MWKVVTRAGVAGAPQAENKDYDEVNLSSDASQLGGSMKRFLADYQSRSGAGHLESASRQ